ncbi:MAG TPA: lipopolysaccharide heptosyltransferase family protein [Chromatiales bacterium]|nr:lipopolysaccharide heptosyltransferase family protein [Chromatiales bacterium]
MSLPLTRPPATLCLLRLSALGDVCHAVPVMRTLQKVWPETRLSWIIGKTEHALLGDIPGIEFITFDKTAGLAAYRQLWRQLRGRHFDVLLHMQMSLRASLASRLVPARIRLGFDKARARDLQWLFTNARIAPVPRQHVLDSFFAFLNTLGIEERVLDWNIPIPAEAREAILDRLPSGPFLVISPCSSMAYRNWTVEGYAAVADYVAGVHGLPTVLTGGNSPTELRYGEEIVRLARSAPVNLVGQTRLKELLAVIDAARLLLAPDSGPAHLATATGTPVVSLFAATNPDRARPYLSPELVVNQYPEAIEARYHKTVAEVPWGTRVRTPGTMARIHVDEVRSRIDLALL